MTLQAAPLLPLGAAFAAGILGGEWLGAGPLPCMAAACALLLASAVALTRGRERAAAGFLVAGMAALGALRAGGPPLPADHIGRLALPPVVAVEGRLVEEPVRWAADRTRLLLDVEAVQDGTDRRPASGRIQVTAYGEAPALGEGQRAALEARLHRPIGYRNPGGFDYPAHLRREGILLVGTARAEALRPLGPDAPPWPARMKRWAVATIRARLPEASAALLAGLLLGERAALPRATDDAFRRAGVYHVLAVSGFNIALVAASVFATLSLLGMPRRATALLAAAAVIGFALVVGAQPSVLRATAMGLALLLGILLERESHLINALALAGLALLAWNPADLWDPGFQLSFAATAGIVCLAPGAASGLVARGWPRWLAAALAVSLAAQVAVTPIMLAHFNGLSLVGVAANLLVVPLAGAATMIGMLAVLLSLVSDLAADSLFGFLWLVLLALRAMVWAAAAVPWAMVHLPAPGWGGILAWYAALALAPRARAHRAALGAMAALLLGAAALSAWPWLEPGDGRLRITFLDVGQGDATLVEVPGGPRILVDGGPGGQRRFDVGERVLAPFLWGRPVGRLDVVALTHADLDHAGGLTAVLHHFPVGEFWESGRWPAGAEETLGVLARSQVPRRVLSAGQRLWLGEALITVLGPAGGPPAGSNDESLVLRLDWRGFSLLLTGDLGWKGEGGLLAAGRPLRALVLKVGHHGSRFSSTAAFLEAVRPALAVVSAGARNPFRHPAPEALARLEAAGARIYRTDRDGAILLETDGVELTITRWVGRLTERFELYPERAM